MDLVAGKISPLPGAEWASRGVFWSLQMHSRCTAAEFSLENPSFLMSHKSLQIKDWCLRQDSNLH